MSNVGRWKYKTAVVTVEGNSQTVRMLTAGERNEFAASTGKIKAGEMTAAQVAARLLAMAAIDPPLTPEDIEQMPPDLYEACTNKILELTGLKSELDVAGDQKKDLTASLPLNS